MMWISDTSLVGYVLVRGESVVFRLDILTNEDSFRIIPRQNPFITAMVGKNTVIFGKNMVCIHPA